MPARIVMVDDEEDLVWITSKQMARARPEIILEGFLDPQGGIGLSLAKEDDELPGLADLMTGMIGPEAAILPTRLPGLSLLPRGRLDPTEVCDYERALFAPNVLSNTLEKAEAGFDFVLIDTSSGLGMVTRAALALSDFALVPFQTENLSLRSRRGGKG